MGNNLNPDGARIKALRIQRGWTQEQLAEIAGVSTRTIQRAERANAAAFETLRAVAGAFEADFHQLLRPEACDAPDGEYRAVQAESLPDRGPDIVESVSASRQEVAVRRVWPIYAIALSALALGIFTGVKWTSYAGKSTETNAALVSSAGISPYIVAHNDSPDPAPNAQEPEPMRNEVPVATVQAVKSRLETEGKRDKATHADTSRIETAKVVIIETAVPGTLHRTQKPAEFEAMPEPRDLFSTHAIPEIDLASSASSEADVVEPEDGSEPGAVRQALGQAAKKTGSAFAKVGTSLKRVF